MTGLNALTGIFVFQLRYDDWEYGRAFRLNATHGHFLFFNHPQTPQSLTASIVSMPSTGIFVFQSTTVIPHELLTSLNALTGIFVFQ